jgi:hypothetical protein
VCHAPAVQACDLRPDAGEQVIGQLVVGHVGERPGVQGLVGQHHGAVVDPAKPEESGRLHAQRGRAQGHQRLVLDAPPQGRERTLVTDVFEPDGPIHAEEQVGAALIGADHLHEAGGAVAEIGEVGGRAPGVDVGGPQPVDRQPCVLQCRTHAGGRRSPIAHAEREEHHQADRPPGGHRSHEVDRQPGAGDDPPEGHDAQRAPCPPTPASGHRGGDHGHRGSDTGQVRRARVRRAGDPAARLVGCVERGRADAVGRPLDAVHHQVGHDAGEKGEEQRPPAAQHGQGERGGDRAMIATSWIRPTRKRRNMSGSPSNKARTARSRSPSGPRAANVTSRPMATSTKAITSRSRSLGERT